MNKKKIVLSILFFLSFFTKNIHTKVMPSILNKKLKILFVTDKFPWHTKHYITYQAICLVEHGHDVVIYARDKAKNENDDLALQYNLYEKTVYKVIPNNLDEYDLIICQYATDGKIFAQLKKEKNLKAKLVVCIRGGDITSEANIANNSYEQMFQVADLFLPVCEFFKSKLIILGCKPSKIEVLHSAIDCEKFYFKVRELKKHEPIRFISVNRLYEEKANEYVIKALARIRNRYPNMRYTIIGDGPDKKRLEQIVRKFQMSKNIVFAGWKSRDEIIQLLHASHIFILPSVTASRGATEGIPNALKEAMATGMPVISTYHAGIPELISNNLEGYLVPERDIHSLTVKIKHMINNPGKWKQMGINARDRVYEQYDISNVNIRFLELLSNVMGITL